MGFDRKNRLLGFTLEEWTGAAARPHDIHGEGAVPYWAKNFEISFIMQAFEEGTE